MIWLFSWWILGVIIVLYEMHFDMDVDVGWLLFALACGIVGPFWIWRTLYRKKDDNLSFLNRYNVVLIKRKS